MIDNKHSWSFKLRGCRQWSAPFSWLFTPIMGGMSRPAVVTCMKGVESNNPHGRRIARGLNPRICYCCASWGGREERAERCGSRKDTVVCVATYVAEVRSRPVRDQSKASRKGIKGKKKENRAIKADGLRLLHVAKCLDWCRRTLKP